MAVMERDEAAKLEEMRKLARDLQKATNPRTAYEISTRLNELSKQLGTPKAGARKSRTC